ncbi:PREDICTED: phosphatidylinositol-glycan biosynthesis class X protein [Tarenaya hassleriana]|uniref:phosphatidylinositol-glycan biosynthesis class X protein n=1 Tax=Tarenaya hassleriana TaxID=28532 RepID=UPI00053C89B4|nr:PREDICTED: phosphatidylinositol-glycan biosynthesis class X protein [Tarenaya hassleriana]
METQRKRLIITLIFLCYAASCLDFSSSSSSDQVGAYGDSDKVVGSNGIQSFCTSDRYIMQSYFSTHTSLDDSEFRDFLLKESSCGIPTKDPTFAPTISLLHRNIAGEGSHRHLLTSVSLLLLPPQFHELVIIERLPLGVFADPFELQNLRQRKVFREMAVFGDTNLELPSFRSNRSVVEIHVELDRNDHGNSEIGLMLPLHARYQPLEESGYSRIEFGDPDVLVCRGQDTNRRSRQTRCLVLSVGRSEIGSVVWEIPAGIRYHTEIVSVVTFAAAVLSAIAIVMASAFSSKV